MGFVFEIAALISRCTFICVQHSQFIAAVAENPILNKLDVAKGTSIFTNFSLISFYIACTQIKTL
jgi:hypothetical protein